MRRYNNVVQTSTGQAVAGASVIVTVASTPAGTGGPATVYNDDGLTQISNSLFTDNLGRFAFYVPSGKYDLAISGGTPLVSTPFILANEEIADHLEFKPLDSIPLAGEVLNLTQVPSGAAPPAGSINLYSKVTDRLLYYKDAFGAETGPLLPLSGGPAFSTLAVKPQISDHLQYVSPNGNDLNDGLSIGSAKLTVYEALKALPGGSSTTAGSGTVLISGAVNYGGPVANQGMWLMAPGDPNFASPPAGWLKAPAGGILAIDCFSKSISGSHGHDPSCLMQGGGNTDNVHPAVWISAVQSTQITLKNLSFSNNRSTYVKYGIDSNNNRNGSGGSAGFSMYNVSWIHGGQAGAGPGMDIGSNSFWIWLKGLAVSGSPTGVFTIASSGASRVSGTVTITTTTPHNVLFGDTITITNVLDNTFNGSFTVAGVVDNLHFTYLNPETDSTSGSGQVVTAAAAAINMDPGTGPGNSLVFIDDINLNNGNIRYVPGINGGSLYVRNVSYESDNTTPDPPTVLITSTRGGAFIHIENVETADTINPVNLVQVDNNSGHPDFVVVSRIAGQVRGCMTVLGGTQPSVFNITPLRQGQYGLLQGQITATGIDTGRRGFSPVAALGTNIALPPASWTFRAGSGTVTPGFAGPDGTSNAVRVTSNGGVALADMYFSTTNLNLGDVYVYGVWVRSVNNNGYASGVPPIRFTHHSAGLGVGDTCASFQGNPPGDGVVLGNLTGSNQSDGQWQWYSGVCRVAANPTSPGTAFSAIASSTNSVDFYAPTVLLFPAGTKSDNETWEIANNLSSSAGNAGEVSMLPSQLFRPGSTGFSGLGTPANGVFIYCSDCTIANPCASGGTGALAKRLGGVWICN